MNTRFKDQWLATSALALAIGCVGIPTGAVAQASFSKEANLKTASVKAEQVNVNTADAKAAAGQGHWPEHGAEDCHRSKEGRRI